MVKSHIYFHWFIGDTIEVFPARKKIIRIYKSKAKIEIEQQTKNCSTFTRTVF